MYISKLAILQVFLLLLSAASGNAQYGSQMDEFGQEERKLIYCTNLFAEINKQESARNYNQVVRLRQQYAYVCNR
jgi:hypothetical protein